MKISKGASQWVYSPIRKFHPLAVNAEKSGKKIYHLNIGQPDLATPKEYYEAVRSFSVDTLAYASSPGMPVLVQAIKRYYENIGVSLEDEEILVTAGGSEALLLTFLSILDEGSEVIVPEPYYPNYSNFILSAGAQVCPLPTSPEEGYRYGDEKKIEALINEKTRAIMINNPNNPTGVVLTKEEMRVLADVAKEHDLYLISDEVYREFCYDGQSELSSFGTFTDIDENLVIVDSASKRFSACGARIGCVITRNKQLQQTMLKFCQSRLSVATIDQVGAAALYGVSPDFFAESKAEYQRRRDTIVEALRKIPGVKAEVPEGAFYLMVTLPVDDTDRFQAWLLEHFDDNGDTIMFAPGAPFYTTPGRGNNEIRVAYVLKQEDLIRAVEVLGKGIAQYQKEQMK